MRAVLRARRSKLFGLAQHPPRDRIELDDELYSVFKGATARLSHNEILIRTAELDELGNFVLDDLAPGTYQLAVHLPDREVIVEALAL